MMKMFKPSPPTIPDDIKGHRFVQVDKRPVTTNPKVICSNEIPIINRKFNPQTVLEDIKEIGEKDFEGAIKL